MSVRRRRSLAAPVARAALALRRAEAAISLLDRVRPRGLGGELSRLQLAFESGRRVPPALRYGEPASLAGVRRELDEINAACSAGPLELRLLGERAAELALEAALAEHVGMPGFSALSAQRFPLPPDAERVESLARQLLSGPEPAAESGALHRSDDRGDPHSLWSQLSRLLSQARWAVRIEVVPGLVSLAAVADGVVRVRAGARLTERVARRIALHEVEGHVRPRVVGQALGGAFTAGTARASEDEEGRAIWLEERAGLLDAGRLRELARRYLAAASVRRGASLWDTVELVHETGASIAASIELACRVHRGGGLARELVYFTGFLRAARELASRPELGEVQASGRVSLEAAALLLGDSVELDDHGDVV